MITKPISVLLPVHKKIDFHQFKRSINSIIYKQSVIPKEFLVIIDGPVDERIFDYVKYLKKTIKYSNILIIKHSTNKGLGPILKDGVKRTKYDLILRCDSDDFSKKNRVKLLYNFHLKNKDVSVIDSAMGEYFGKQRMKRYVDNKKKNDSNYFKLRNVINHPTILMKKKDILKAGNYEDVPFFEDYYLWIKLIKKKFKFAGINKVLVNTNTDLKFYERRSGIKYLNNYKFFLKKCLKIKFINKFEFYSLFFSRSLIILSNKNIIKFFYNKFMRETN
jgi:glycosyltransferase involved in cell wall biosynthesis